MSQRVADEIENRRGLVLGLTLAELLLLLLFLFLLALAWRIDDLQKEAKAFEKRAQHAESIASSLDAKLQGMEFTLAKLQPLLIELQSKGGLDPHTIRTLVEGLTRLDILEKENSFLKNVRAELSGELARLKQATADSKKIASIDAALSAASQIDPNDPPAALIRAVEVLKKLGPDVSPDRLPSLIDRASIAELREKQSVLEAEKDKYQRQVANMIRSGNGLTYPSCWINADNRTEYMFDITIRDEGLLVRDATPSRAEDAQMKMVQSFDRGATIDEQAFQKATTRIFNWSVEQRCRFYAIVRDDTGPTSKQRYKKLRTLVEGHFYPLHLALDAPAPRNSPTNARDEFSQMGGPLVQPSKQKRKKKQ